MVLTKFIVVVCNPLNLRLGALLRLFFGQFVGGFVDWFLVGVHVAADSERHLHSSARELLLWNPVGEWR